MRFLLGAVAVICLLIPFHEAWGVSGPDNKYCSPGNHPQFGTHDGPAALPRACLNTAEASAPSPGKTISVPAGGDLQGALDSAQCGDVVSIQANATFVGNFRLKAAKCDSGHWITIRTSASNASLPLEGTRLTPCYAGVGALSGRPALSCSKVQRVIPKIASPRAASAFVLMDGANHYRLLGLEITRNAGTGFIAPLIGISKDGRANNIVVDRSWVHGTAQDDTGSGVNFDGMTFAAVIDSYLNDFHCTSRIGACTDAHAIGGGVNDWPGGPYKIVNNFLEASGENILMGGGPATTTPADIEIRRNYIYKPLIWMKGHAGFVGGKGGNPFIVKNLTEFKNAQRVLFEGNVWENSWGGFTQNGAVLLLSAKNQFANGRPVCPLCQVTDITVRYSRMSHSGVGICMAAGLTGKPKLIYQAKAAARYSIHDITIDDVNAAKYRGGGTLIQIFNGWPKNGLNTILIEHVTGFGDPASHLLSLINSSKYPKIPNVGFSNNLLLSGRYPIWSGGGPSACATSVFPKENLDTCLNPYAFVGNGIIASPEQYPPSKWPLHNEFADDANAVQFVNYNNANGGNYQLLSSSPYRKAASDGKDLGADINAINAATADVD